MKLYLLYKRLKINEIKSKKFTPNDLQVFILSKEKSVILNFIKSDLNISKLFFEEYIKYLKNI